MPFDPGHQWVGGAARGNCRHRAGSTRRPATGEGAGLVGARFPARNRSPGWPALHRYRQQSLGKIKPAEEGEEAIDTPASDQIS